MRLTSLILVAAAALPAAAQTSQPAAPDDAAAKQRTAALLQKLAFDKKLLGTIRMGLYLNAKNLGTMVITVKAAAKGSGAVYEATAKANMSFGPMKNSFTETVLLDAALGLIKLTGSQEELEPQAGGTNKRTKLLEKKDGKWQFTATFDNGQGNKSSQVLTAPDEGPNHWEIGGLILLSRLLDLKTPGRYLLRGIKFPELTANGWGGGAGPKAAWKPITIDVPKPKSVKIRGKEVKVVRVKVVRQGEGGGPQYMLLDASGTFYGVEADQMPIKMLVGTEKEIARDLDEGGDMKAVKAAVKIWFEVACKKKKLEALDPIVDWGVYAAARKKADPSLKDKTAMDLAAEAKKALGSIQVPGGEQILGMLDMALQTKVTGDAATVSIQGGPGGGGPTWKLKKISGTWKLVEFPLAIN